MPASERSRPGFDGELGRQSSADESFAPTLPGFRNNGSEIPSEMSGRRIRPDATVRGIGPDASIAYTMDVRNSEVDIVSDLELQKAWMPRTNYRAVWAVGAAGMLLVVGVLFALTRKPAVAEHAPPQELGAVEEVAAAPKLDLPAPEREVAAPAPVAKDEPKKVVAKAPAKVKPKLAARGKTKGKTKAGKKKKAVRASMSASLR